jgi:hypothetical protein
MDAWKHILLISMGSIPVAIAGGQFAFLLMNLRLKWVKRKLLIKRLFDAL